MNIKQIPLSINENWQYFAFKLHLGFQHWQHVYIIQSRLCTMFRLEVSPLPESGSHLNDELRNFPRPRFKLIHPSRLRCLLLQFWSRHRFWQVALPEGEEVWQQLFASSSFFYSSAPGHWSDCQMCCSLLCHLGHLATISTQDKVRSVQSQSIEQD